MKFEELNLAPQLLQALTACGYEEPTPIQAQTIPALLAGSDLIGSAQTGTGKTAAFVLPALNRLGTPAAQPKTARRGVGMPRVLVLAPTRELAQQVADQVVRYGQFLRAEAPYASTAARPTRCRTGSSSAASTCWWRPRVASSITSTAAASTCRGSRC